MALHDDAADTGDLNAPLSIRITLWLDRDIDLDISGCQPWLAQAALARAYELLEPSYLDIEDDLEEGDPDDS